MQSGCAKLYTLRYNVTIYAYFNVTIRYVYYIAYYTLRYNVATPRTFNYRMHLKFLHYVL